MHELRPNPDRIRRLPLLLDRYYSPNLGRQLMRLWHGDSARAAILRNPLMLGRAVSNRLLARLRRLRAA